MTFGAAGLPPDFRIVQPDGDGHVFTVPSELPAEVHRGTLADLDSLRAAAASADGVIHAAFIHDFIDQNHLSEAVRRRSLLAGREFLAANDSLHKPLLDLIRGAKS